MGIGSAFALTEAQLIMATIAPRYDLAPASDRPVVPEALVTLRPRGGLPLRPRRLTPGGRRSDP